MCFQRVVRTIWSFFKDIVTLQKSRLSASLFDDYLLNWPDLTLLRSERPKLHKILAFLSAIGLKTINITEVLCLLSLFEFMFTSLSDDFLLNWPDFTLLCSERPKLHTILSFLSAIGLKTINITEVLCLLRNVHCNIPTSLMQLRNCYNRGTLISVYPFMLCNEFVKL